MEDMEEIKEVGGRRYSKMTQLYTDIVTAQYILEANSGDTGYRPLRSDLALQGDLSRVLIGPEFHSVEIFSECCYASFRMPQSSY